MKNELGIEVKCKNCIYYFRNDIGRVLCDKRLKTRCEEENSKVFRPRISKLEERKKEQQEQQFTEEENATCKKNLQLTRSDIEHMVEPVENLHLFDEYKNQTVLIKSGCFSLDETKERFKNWLVDLICSALKIED